MSTRVSLLEALARGCYAFLTAGKGMFMENRRRRTRVEFHTHADIIMGERSFLSLKTQDLSLKGLSVGPLYGVQTGTNCQVVIHLLEGLLPEAELHLQGKVARADHDGVAIDFTSMDPETYLHLRKLVVLNASDPDQAVGETTDPAFNPADE